MTRGTFRFLAFISVGILFWQPTPASVGNGWWAANLLAVINIKEKKNQLKLRKCPRLVSTNVFLNASVYATFIFRIKKLLVVWQGPRCILWSWEPHQRPAPSSFAHLRLRTKGCTPSPGTSCEQSYPFPPCTVKKKNECRRMIIHSQALKQGNFSRDLRLMAFYLFHTLHQETLGLYVRKIGGGGGVERSKTFLGFSRQS